MRWVKKKFPTNFIGMAAKCVYFFGGTLCGGFCVCVCVLYMSRNSVDIQNNKFMVCGRAKFLAHLCTHPSLWLACKRLSTPSLLFSHSRWTMCIKDVKAELTHIFPILTLSHHEHPFHVHIYLLYSTSRPWLFQASKFLFHNSNSVYIM